MTTAWVIMAAMPPTKGHLNLIRFAAGLPVDRVNVIVHTRPVEPHSSLRFLAVNDAVEAMRSRWRLLPRMDTLWLNSDTIEDPSADGFWEQWDSIMHKFGFAPGDMWVTSEPYGQTLANRMEGIFIPYDPKRELLPVKATPIRSAPREHFDEILPEFQQHIRKTVTFFGAESTGKTTLSRLVADAVNGHWLFEWARPYLETVGKEITKAKMEEIWMGQLATQRHARMFEDKPFIIQDTDLFSTIGYWAQPHWTEKLGPVPERLISDALFNLSDLYIIPQSNIPFERDGIRYGIDKRESPDVYWIDLAKQYDLNYIVLDAAEIRPRQVQSVEAIKELFDDNHGLTFDRGGF